MDKRTREKYKKILLEMRAQIFDQINGLSEDTLSSSQRDSSGDLSQLVDRKSQVVSVWNPLGKRFRERWVARGQGSEGTLRAKRA